MLPPDSTVMVQLPSGSLAVPYRKVTTSYAEIVVMDTMPEAVPLLSSQRVPGFGSADKTVHSHKLPLPLEQRTSLDEGWQDQQ